MLTEKLMADPEESVDRLIGEHDGLGVIPLSMSLQTLCVRRAGEGGQRADLAMALVDALAEFDEVGGAERPAAAAAFRAALRDEEQPVRAWAAEGLGVVGDRGDVDALHRLALNPDEDSFVREEAVHSLYLIDPDGLVQTLRRGQFDAGVDSGFGVVVRTLRAALIDPGLALTIDDMKPMLGSADEYLLLTYISHTLRLLDSATSLLGLPTMCGEIAKLASYETSPEIEACVTEVVQWQQVE